MTQTIATLICATKQSIKTEIGELSGYIFFFFAASRLRQLCVSGLLYARGSFHATVYHWHRTNDFTETT